MCTLCRLVCFKKSFFPSVISEWNKLSQDIVSYSSISIFKSKIINLNNVSNGFPSVSQMGSVSYGFSGEMLTQIRLGLSPLRHHLFTYNIAHNPFCDSCGLFVEDVSHYLLSCKTYNSCRIELIELINNLSLITGIYCQN